MDNSAAEALLDDDSNDTEWLKNDYTAKRTLIKKSFRTNSWFLSNSTPEGEYGSSETNTEDSGRTLSTFSGVFSPVALSMFSTFLFLRIGFGIGQGGLLLSCIQLVLAYFILSMTILSICAVSTNGKVEGGGAYFMISRTLGPEFGGAIGVIFYLANIFACALYVSAFVEGLEDNFGPGNTLLPHNSVGIPNVSKWWTYLYCTGILALCLFICLVGSALFAKVSVLILLLVFACFLSIPISMFLREPFCVPFPKTNPFSQPSNYSNMSTPCGNYTGFSKITFKENMGPHDYAEDYLTRNKMTFATVFSILFSSVTGIMNGANMSGELKKPNKAIPRGTVLATLFTFTVYFVLHLFVSATTSRKLLLNNYVFLQSINKCPPIIVCGIFAATISAALGNLIGASRILIAVAKDEIYWKLLQPVTKTIWGGNPIFSVLVSAFLVQLILLIGSLNSLAPITTVFFLILYASTNLTCLALTIASPPNFRPTFRYFNWLTASLGLAGSLIMCFLVNPIFAAIGISVMLIIFVMLSLRSFPPVWGSFSQALIFHQVRKYMLMLDTRKEHVRFWRPNVLLLANNARSSIGSIFICNDLKKSGLYIIGHVNVEDRCNEDAIRGHLKKWLDLVNEFKVKAFVEITSSPTLNDGVQQLVRLSGIGAIKPNTICLGFYDETSPVHHNPKNFLKKSYFSADQPLNSLLDFEPLSSTHNQSVEDWVRMLINIIDMEKNICILRHMELLTYENKEGFIDIWPVSFLEKSNRDYIDTTSQLMLQLACVVHMRDNWKKCKLRVFLCTDNIEDVIAKENRLTDMLKELRIPAIVHLISWHCEDDSLAEYGNYLIKQQCSLSTRLIFLYLQYPYDDNYNAFQRNLNNLTENLPPTILVHGVRSVVTTRL